MRCLRVDLRLDMFAIQRKQAEAGGSLESSKQTPVTSLSQNGARRLFSIGTEHLASHRKLRQVTHSTSR